MPSLKLQNACILATSNPKPRGGGYSHTLPIRVCAAQRGRDFEAPDLERGIIFRTHESSSTPGDYEEAFI